MVSSLVLDQPIAFPLDIRISAHFQNWMKSDQFPERARLDLVASVIEVDIARVSRAIGLTFPLNPISSSYRTRVSRN